LLRRLSPFEIYQVGPIGFDEYFQGPLRVAEGAAQIPFVLENQANVVGEDGYVG
jgi:hypothetical protein